jgi:tetratricopeptide (TPR) repeat protein
MDEIFKRILDTLKGADFWIALGFLAAGYVCWRWIATTTRGKKKVLRRQIGMALLVAVLAGAVILVNHLFFLRERGFSKNLTGVLVTRIVGDDALDSLQGDLVGKLNAELQKEEPGQQIEVHASSEMVNENYGLKVAHERARAIGQRLNAKIVIWGRKIGENKFYPRITVMAPLKDWSAALERTHDEQSITELHLPEELVDEPFYLIHFAAGYSYFVQNKYEEALPHFKAALGRQGGLPNELADLQFLTAFCHHSLSADQESIAANLQEAIGLYENAARVYEKIDQEKWAATQNNLSVLHLDLPTGDRAANTQKAIAAANEAIRVDPKNAKAYYNRGNAYRHNGDYDKAIADNDQAIRLDPKLVSPNPVDHCRETHRSTAVDHPIQRIDLLQIVVSKKGLVRQA